MSSVENGRQKPLISYVMDGNSGAVQAALAAGANVNGNPEQPFPPIVAATLADHARIVLLLLERGADPNKPVTRKVPCPTANMAAAMPGERALHIAARSGNRDIVGLLLQRSRADPNATDTRGYTPLNAICDSSHVQVEVMQLLLEGGADPTLADRNGLLPLHVVALRGYIDLVDMLHSRAPATLNRCASNGQTPLFLASSGNQERVVEKLLSLGAMQPKPLIGDSMPLSLSAGHGFVGVVRALITKRGMRAVGGGLALPNALYAAVHARRAVILRLLLGADGENKQSKWANAELNSSIEGFGLLHFGAAYCCPAAVSILLEAGADEAAKDAEGCIPADVIGGCLGSVSEPSRGREEEVAICRMLRQGPAYRARSWAWSSDEKADAGGSSVGFTATAAAAAPPSSVPAVKPAPTISVRIFRPKKTSSRKVFVRLVGRYCAKK